MHLKRQCGAKVVDIFAGAGGLSLAARNLGCEVVLAVENNGHAAGTYNRNLGCSDSRSRTRLYVADIMELDPAGLAGRHFPGDGRCDLLLGGPPCQGFSTHRINDSGVGDPRNDLVYRYFDFVRALQPRAFLMENVAGFLWPRHASHVAEFYRLAECAGYKVFEPAVLDARNYGVPQRRKRVFVLGIHASLPGRNALWPPIRSHADGTDERLPAWLPCADAFLPAPAEDPNDMHMNHGPEIVEAFRTTPPNGGSRRHSGRVLPCHVNHDGHKDVYGRIDPEKPAPTMTTACINPSKGRFVHPTEHHGITIRQAARIQTFPDDFVFVGGILAAGRQIGNAVPIRFGEALISEALGFLSAEIERQPSRARAKGMA